MPKPGWAISTVRGPYARSYPFYHGQTLTEGVREIAWSGRLADDFIDDFVFAGFLADTLPAGEMLFFPTYQECEKGEWRWIEVPSAGQDAHALAQPAPGVRLLPAAQKAETRTYKVGSLVIEAPWTRATPGGAQVAGGFLKVTNTGSQPDRLIGGTLAPAATVEVHEMTMSDGVMKMRRLEKGLEIAPGQTVELKPGGYHMMFMGLRDGLKEGQSVKGSLVFEKAGAIEVEFRVAPIGAQSGSGHKHH
jgi:copper(I)-binding protein